jgi:hypothetical protein
MGTVEPLTADARSTSWSCCSRSFSATCSASAAAARRSSRESALSLCAWSMRALSACGYGAQSADAACGRSAAQQRASPAGLRTSKRSRRDKIRSGCSRSSGPAGSAVAADASATSASCTGVLAEAKNARSRSCARGRCCVL